MTLLGASTIAPDKRRIPSRKVSPSPAARFSTADQCDRTAASRSRSSSTQRPRTSTNGSGGQVLADYVLKQGVKKVSVIAIDNSGIQESADSFSKTFVERGAHSIVQRQPATDDEVSVYVVDRGGIAAEIPSRTERDPVLRGTKHTVASERELLVFRGRRDDRTLIAVPETKDNHCTGITQLHVRFEDRLPVATCRSVLQGYRNRYAAASEQQFGRQVVRRRCRLPGSAINGILTASRQ